MSKKFKVEFDCDNAAFAGGVSDLSEEIGRILRELSTRFTQHEYDLNMPDTSGYLKDKNGNVVGAWSLNTDEDDV